MFGILTYDKQENEYLALVFRKKEDAIEAFSGLKSLGNLKSLSISNKIKVKLAMDKLSFVNIIKIKDAPENLEIINKSEPLLY
ncbi:hypothetical protein SAMN02745163_00158 [Clostridium cavendishii DSM 21758]|uniref:Uncharacterized protein n=1 Tax=Clostridium cavendishii DSM 21758 TaxID=1121302 RepID=A0A1M6ARP8_9CLOT|nr:hypothetical protein [Clostridium cavendishii]SHI39091.1 hypothetical protein SAMN02745163_00158 [Clostridium cavendishii DSM 21758]